jgi:hypothetical protein
MYTHAVYLDRTPVAVISGVLDELKVGADCQPCCKLNTVVNLKHLLIAVIEVSVT